MTAAGEAVAATAAGDVALAADDVAGGEGVDVGADGDDLAHELVADGERHLDGGLGPLVPLKDMNVGAADAGVVHADQYVVDADGRLGDIFKPQSPLSLAFDQRLHANSLRVSPLRCAPCTVDSTGCQWARAAGTANPVSIIPR